MISYLKGIVAGIHKLSNQRVILSLEVNQIGYDLQIPPRLVPQLPAIGQPMQIFTHLQIREEQMVLYGFASSAERDLYRQLVSVTGIGTQLAIALLDTLGLEDLVQAIVTGNTQSLVKTPGVGQKTAARIALELKTKLSEWYQQSGLTIPLSTGLTLEMQEDLEMTLLALGYTNREIMVAIQFLSSQPQFTDNPDPDHWIRGAIAHLGTST